MKKIEKGVEPMQIIRSPIFERMFGVRTPEDIVRDEAEDAFAEARSARIAARVAARSAFLATQILDHTEAANNLRALLQSRLPAGITKTSRQDCNGCIEVRVQASFPLAFADL